MIAEAIVGGLAQELVKIVSTAIQEQEQYAVQFPNQFRELVEQLKFMQAFIADASRKRDNSETVKTTIASLQEIVYQADDLVVDCRIREDYQNKEGNSACFCSLSEVCFRLETGKKLKEINNEIQRMRDNLKSYYNPNNSQVSSENSNGGRRWSAEVFNQSEVVGLEEDAETIKGWIQKQNEPQLHVGIVGMGGLGKTTLAKKIYNDSILTRRYNEKIWISVSQPVNVDDILKSMLQQLNEEDTGLVRGIMLTRISKLLSNKSYLLVLDDVWSTDDGWWTSLSSGLPKPEENQNCIIITSRDEQVVQNMGVREEEILQPRLLTDQEGWELLCKVVRLPATEQKSFEAVGKRIVDKCGFLPLAIKTIGGVLLSLKHKNFVSEYDWDRVCENFHRRLTEEGSNTEGNGSVIASLQLSYDELPARLKPCLLCFSIYPEDREIDVDQLIHWWVGEGFVRGGSEETATELALSCLSELISRCLVEVGQRRNFDGSVHTCKVHDMVRDLTIKIAREEEFCTFSKNGRHLTNSRTRRLGVTSDTKLQDLWGNSKLRALLLTSTDYIRFDRNLELAKVFSLRVLDLSKVKLDRINEKDLWEWITSLKRLAYLNLREVATLYEVPSSIAKLWGLQVLILEECKLLKVLPSSIVKLPRLIFLSVGNCPSLKRLPQGFFKLNYLQELYGFKVGGSGTSAGSSHLSDLENMTQLRVLQIDITEESKIQDPELEVLAKLDKLKLLSINAGEQGNDILTQLGKLKPPPSVEELYLKHYLGETLPEWVSPKKLKKLQYLCIEHSRVKQMSEDFLGRSKCEPGETDQCKWDVKGLCLKFCQMLELTWDEVQYAMPLIRYLEISQCTSLEGRGFPCNVTATGFWPKEEDKKEVVTQRMVSTKTIDST